MIVWINGAFGVGKTHTSYELLRRTENTFLFDPEKVGFFLRKFVYKSDQYEDFQNHPLWRKQVLDNLIFCDQQNVITIVPMTIVEDEIFDYVEPRISGCFRSVREDLEDRGNEVFLGEKKCFDVRPGSAGYIYF